MKEKYTKIVATIGPASDNVETIQKMYESGMDVARLNFSHGTHEYFSDVIKAVRSVSEDIAIMLDTKGPEIRTGELKEDSIELVEGQELIATNKQVKGDKEKITINYDDLKKIGKDSLLLIDDGLIETKVIGKHKEGLLLKVMNGGSLGPKKTVTIRGHNPNIPFLSQKDKEDIVFGANNNLSFIAASFVRTKEDVIELRRFVNKYNPKIKIISKIEHSMAVKNIDDIIEESDGVMVARGDLGVEISLEKVPKIQQSIIKKCNEVGKPVIVATQMLESMKDNPRPTRAEVSDVSQSILQGADAVMLSGETANGKYPVKAVRMMAKIAREYDHRVRNKIIDKLHDKGGLAVNAIALFVTKAAYHASRTLKARAILTPTETGYTARNVSRFKPHCPILAVTPDVTVVRQLKLSWGVLPILETKLYSRADDMVDDLIVKSYKKGIIKKDDIVIVTAGYNLKEKGSTNLLEIYPVKDVIGKLKAR